MNVVIYAAGAGNRLDAHTKAIPKGLVEVAGWPLIRYALERAVRFQPEQIVIVVGYKADMIMKAVGNFYKELPIMYAVNPYYELKGNLSSLWAARGYCKGDTMFTTSDLICTHSNTDRFVIAASKDKILIDTDPFYFTDPDPVKVSIKAGYIHEVLKRDIQGTVAGSSIGIYHFSATAMDMLLKLIEERMKAGAFDVSLYYAINDLCSKIRISPVICDRAKWFDVDTPAELAQANEWVSTHKELYQ